MAIVGDDIPLPEPRDTKLLTVVLRAKLHLGHTPLAGFVAAKTITCWDLVSESGVSRYQAQQSLALGSDLPKRVLEKYEKEC